MRLAVPAVPCSRGRGTPRPGVRADCPIGQWRGKRAASKFTLVKGCHFRPMQRRTVSIE